MEFCPNPKFHGISWNFFSIFPSSMEFHGIPRNFSAKMVQGQRKWRAVYIIMNIESWWNWIVRGNFASPRNTRCLSNKSDICVSMLFLGMIHCVRCCNHLHHSDVMMGTMAYQITSLTTVYSTVYSKKKSKLSVTGLCEGNYFQLTGWVWFLPVKIY